ncbi:integrating conjugative element membrane protein [Gilliamella sp. wkB18]|uniref:TIGR03745 family integrating conjugative element membrane protein n=1 Tax=Gilliamella sp. wkB18 TaxID=3120260 RepID=UPI000827B8D2|nr:TIGR03745 family integrating conjugative element membrane protein [Gilliamella apicola]OCG64106.1 integrating conjugative element membrane protein [Gilliamella apicola]
MFKIKTVSKLFQIKNTVKGTLMSLVFFGGEVFAKMPKIEDPSQGKQNGIMANMQAYIYDGFVVGGLVVVAACLFVAAKNILVEYNNIGEGKGSWAKFGTLVVIGVVLVVACIWFATLAADTLSS